jgi:hypothetical protein
VEKAPQPKLNGELPGPPAHRKLPKYYAQACFSFFHRHAPCAGPQAEKNCPNTGFAPVGCSRRPNAPLTRCRAAQPSVPTWLFYRYTNSVYCQWFYSDILTNFTIRTSRYCFAEMLAFFSISSPSASILLKHLQESHRAILNKNRSGAKKSLTSAPRTTTAHRE